MLAVGVDTAREAVAALLLDEGTVGWTSLGLAAQRVVLLPDPNSPNLAVLTPEGRVATGTWNDRGPLDWQHWSGPKIQDIAAAEAGDGQGTLLLAADEERGLWLADPEGWTRVGTLDALDFERILSQAGPEAR